MVVSIVLYGFVAIVVAAALFVLATRFLPAGEQIAPPLRDEPVWSLPVERSLRPEEVDGVRLPVALRGYRFAETDVLLDRLVHELRQRDDEIARLRGDDGHPSPRPVPVDERAYARPAADHATDPGTDAVRAAPATGDAEVDPAGYAPGPRLEKDPLAPLSFGSDRRADDGADHPVEHGDDGAAPSSGTPDAPPSSGTPDAPPPYADGSTDGSTDGRGRPDA